MADVWQSQRARILAVVYTLRRGRYRIISGRLRPGTKERSMKKTKPMRAEYRREDLMAPDKMIRFLRNSELPTDEQRVQSSISHRR